MATQPQAVAKLTPKDNAIVLMKGFLEKRQNEIQRALPTAMHAEKFLRVVITYLQGDNAVALCDPASIYKSVLEAAQLGLEPDSVLGHSYLIPYKGQATLQIGYRGFIKLILRSGEVSSVNADIVYENDLFEFERGTNEHLIHRPCLKGPRGKMYAVYAYVVYRNGQKKFEVMTEEDINKIKQSSASFKKQEGPWVTHEEPMWKKSAIRQLSKTLELSTENNNIVRAAVLDEYNEQGLIIDAVPQEERGNQKAGNGYAAKAAELKDKISEKKGQQTATPESQTQSVSGTSETTEPDPQYMKVDDVLIVRGTVTKVFKPSEKKKNVGVKMGKDSFSCWHATLFDVLLGAEGKMCILTYTVNGDYNNIEEVRKVGDIEYDGGVPAMSSDQAAEMSQQKPQTAQGVEGVFQK